MGQKKVLVFGEQARQYLLEGALELELAVRTTLGPMGRNVVIDRPHSGIQPTKDGVSVAEEIEVINPFKNCGVRMIKEAAGLTGKDAGDGTTTSTVLALGILIRGMNAIEAGYNPIEISRGIDAACKLIKNKIQEYVTQINPEGKLLEDVATISANNERDLGEIVAKAIRKATRFGVVKVEENTGYDTYVESIEGFRFDRGYESPLLITDIARQQIVFQESFLLFIDGKIENGKDLVAPLETAIDKGCPLVVIAQDFGPEAMHFIVGNKAHGNAIAAIKAPGFASTRRETLIDMSYLYGGTVYSAENPEKLSDLKVENLGVCGKITITDEDTTILGVTGDKAKIKERGDSIFEQMNLTKSEFDKEKLQDRFAKMTGGIAVIYVGGKSELEVREKRDRVDDAVAATLAALDEGIVPGGGLTLRKISDDLDEELEYPVDYSTKTFMRVIRDTFFGPTEAPKMSGFDKGKSVVYGALCDPSTYIFDNAGLKFGDYAHHVKPDDKYSGFNVLTGKPCDMLTAGIIDPTKVTRVAIENACSVSKMILTTDTLVVPAEQVDPQFMPADD